MATSNEPVQPGGSGPRAVRDRDVVLLGAVIVLGVLAANVIFAFIPPLDEAIMHAPTLAIAMVVISAIVLLRTFRSSRI